MSDESSHPFGPPGSSSLDLSSLALFSEFRPDERARIVALGRVEHWPQGALVLEEGAHGPRMMVLIAGQVEILRTTDAGADLVLATLGPGESVGEMSLLLDLPRTATVRARTDLSVFAMDRRVFAERVAADDPVALKLGFALSRTLARRVRRLNDVVLGLVAENSELRDRFVDARRELYDLWDDPR